MINRNSTFNSRLESNEEELPPPHAVCRFVFLKIKSFYTRHGVSPLWRQPLNPAPVHFLRADCGLPEPSRLNPSEAVVFVLVVPPEPSTLNPQPSTLNPQPSTLNPQPSTLNPQPSTLNTQHSTLNTQHYAELPRAAAGSPRCQIGSWDA